MVKKIGMIVLAAMAWFSPGLVGAEMTVEGTYVVDGDYYDTGDVDYGYYSHELDIAVMFKTDENTYLKTSFGIVDRTWGDDPATIYTSDFTLDRVWLTHKFMSGYTVEAGLMDGGTWGTMLGDADDGYLRLRLAKDYTIGTLCGYVQKNNEIGASDTTVVDGEKDDADEYSVGMIVKAGNVTIMPMVSYADDSSTVMDQGSEGTKTVLVDLAVSGDMGAIGFEAEINYFDVSTDVPGDSDFSNINLYADVWTTMDAIKAGLALAYGTEDDGHYVDFGVDFAPMELMDNDGDISGLGAMMFVKVYGEYTVNEKLSLGAAIAYGDFEEDAVGTSDTGLTEFDITGSYKITDALTYSVALAYGDVDALADPILYLGNEIEFSF
ncbi:MAG: hypothetical protein KKD44_19485 [Proteobacteria bacterium]|nr:hypothetical protein [Pseudomonadota bacterium]